MGIQLGGGETMTHARTRHPVNQLTAVSVKKAGPGKYADGGGLYLVVDPSGARRWELRVTVHGRRREIGLGGVSLLSLAEAREKARALRAVAKDGGDPIAERDKNKRRSMTFEDAARKVHAEQIEPNARNAKHAAQWLSTLETYAFPTMGNRPVHAVDQKDVLRVLAPIWTAKGETARRVRQRVRTVLDWARAAGHREGINPVEGVEKGLPKQRDAVKHHAAYPWRDLPALMERIEGVAGMGALGLRFVTLTAARSGEVRLARWGEIDMDQAEWTVPGERMKAGKAHRVPLSPEALGVLGIVRDLKTGPDSLVFPSPRGGKPMSDMTIAKVLKTLGVEAVPHGMRSTFRDWAEEATSFSHEVKEAALAHTIKNKVEAAYRRTDLFDKRRDLMDAWGRYAVGGAGADVVRLAG